jgi:PAS domain S-box-containing protein
VTRIERFWPLVAAPALLLAGIAGAAGAVSTHQGIALTVLGPLAGLAFVGAGLLGWVLRPDNGTGRLLVVIGFVFLVSTTLWAANDSVLYTTGNAFGSMYLAIFAQLLLSYPAGRLRTRRERVAILALYCVATSAALVPTFFRAKDTSCKNCPANAFLIYDSKQTADVVKTIFGIAGIVVFASLFVVLALRWRRATSARRRVLAPVYICGGAAVGFLGVGFAVDFASAVAGNVFWALALTCFIALPFCFVGGLLRWRLSRAGMRMLLDPGAVGPSAAQASLRRALGDPSLRLAYWLEDQSAYVDPLGDVLDPGARGDGRLTTTISHEARPLAAIEYDASLSHEPELLEEVLAATRLTLEKERTLQIVRLGEARSRALLSVLPDAMIRTNRDGIYLEVQGNQAALVRPAEELLGLSVRETLPAYLVELVLGTIDRTLVTRQLQALEYELEVDGVVRSFEARMIPSGPDEVVTVVRDFTSERQLREELTERLGELEREQSFTATVVNTAPVIFLLVDEAGQIVRFNRTCEQLAGFDDNEAIRGRPFWEVFVDPADWYLAQEMLAGLPSTMPLVEQKLHWRSREGAELVIATSNTSILDAQGTRHILICGLDLTERERHLDELRASRSRIVEAADAERRRLERNLHDGAQQRLVSLSLALRLAQGQIASDPAGASEILGGAGQELAAALNELRELARGLHPAVLTDRGLRAALEGLAGRAALPVDLKVDLERRLPAAVEVAAFYVVAESLTNVAKYAHAGRALVSVACENGLAVVEVRDDGVGGAELSAGSGLRGLSDRLAALTGRLEIDSIQGAGTIVRAIIPIVDGEELAPAIRVVSALE